MNGTPSLYIIPLLLAFVVFVSLKLPVISSCSVGVVVPIPNLFVVLFQNSPLSPPIVLLPLPNATCPDEIES